MVLAAAATGLLAPAAMTAQTLEARVAAAPDGEVRFTFTARPDVVGNGRSMIQWSCNRGDCRQQADGAIPGGDRDDLRSPCDTGPVRVTLHQRQGRTTSLRVAVGGRTTGLSGTDLGRVAVSDAVHYLLALAEASEGDLGGHAIFAATLADSVIVWPDLLRIARMTRVPLETRRSAVFWVSQAAEVAATRGLDSLIDEEAADREVREQAVFALAQRPHDESVPTLIRIAQSNRDPEVRKRAIFWLGQSEDPRALALFEELLTRP